MPHGVVGMAENRPPQSTQEAVLGTRKLRDGKPTDDELEELGHEIENWKQLGRRLGVTLSQLNQIEAADKQQSDKAYRMLLKWKQRKGSSATYKVLCDALVHKLIQRRDLAEQFCYINEPNATQQPAGAVPAGRVTENVSGATASTHDSGDPTGKKRKLPDPDPGPDAKRSVEIEIGPEAMQHSTQDRTPPTTEEILRFIAHRIMRNIPLKTWDEYHEFLTYLEKIRATITGTRTGSLLITVKCDSLQTLETLWEDYLSGHLGEVIQRSFVTEEILTEFSLAELKLKTTISEEEYKACKAYFEKDLSEEPNVIQQHSGAVPAGRVTGEVSGATASTHDSGDSTGEGRALKREHSDPGPEREPSVIQQPSGTVPAGRVTGEVSGATASTHDSGDSIGQKRKLSDTDPDPDAKRLRNGTPSDKELEELSYKVEEWRQLGRRLEFSERQLEQIEAADKQLSERVYRMLLRWKQGEGSSATYKVLCDALEHELVKRQDLADQFCYINEPQQHSGAVPAGRVTGEVSGATTSTHDSGDSTREGRVLKQPHSDPYSEGSVKLKIDVEAIESTELSTQDRTPVSTVESGGSRNDGDASVVPVSSRQKQSTCVNAEAPQAPTHIPTREQVLSVIAAHFMRTTPPSNSDEYNYLLRYLQEIGAILRGTDTG